MTQKKLYALLVGINEYQFPPSSLNGCIADIKRVKAYLEEDQDFEVQIKELLDADATKSKIVQSFREHLGQAQAGDTVLFYFSGHGCQESANEVWTSEFDGKLECVVCHNSEEQYLLADKELRFLVHELHQKSPKAHIVTIFDCCHSGDNTRDEHMQENGEDVRERRYGRAFLERDWSNFIFSDQFSMEDFKDKTISEVLPEGKHIQLAACQSKESAWEINGQGIFTKNLLEVLERSDGDITYYDLKSRIKHYVKAQKPQSPQLYVQGKNNEDFFLTFLGKNRQSKPMYGRIYRKGARIVMDMGRLQGISTWNKLVEIELKNGEKIEAKIEEVQNDRSYLSVEEKDMQQLEEKMEYKGYVSGLSSAPFQLYIKDEDGDPILVDKLQEYLKDLAYIQVVDSPLENDYTLVIRNGMFRITSDYDYIRPLIETVPTDEMDAVLSDLVHISRWLHTKEFKNDEPTFFKDNPYIKVELYQEQSNGEWVVLEQLDDAITLTTKEEDQQWVGKLKVKLINTSKHDLYCALIYLPNNFGAISLLDRDSMMIPAKDFIWAWESEGRVIPLKLEEHTLDYNWEAELHHLKLMVSTKDNLDAQVFLMDELPMPKTLNATMDLTMRGLITRKRGLDDWTTLKIDLRLPNPMYNKITAHKLRELLEHPILSEYALHLYFDIDWEEGIQLKEGIELIEGERGMFLKSSIRNWLNNIIKRNRRKQFERNLRKYPERIMMLSEGDSWFQHPLLEDMIDHLCRSYNIYSIGDAGADLKDYITTAEFETALEDLNQNYITSERPLRYFLLSGGGNDIIGKEMESFLQKDHAKLPASDGFARYLNASFDAKLEELASYITQIHDFATTKVPKLQLLMHGYDYLIPRLDEGWVGQYMTAAGIDSVEERQGLVNYMIDEYYKALYRLEKNLSNFQVLDIRNTVKSYHWYDEIHPSSLGFLMVAGRVRTAIDGEGNIS